MDFGCFAGSDTTAALASDGERSQKRYGSGLGLKHQTSSSNDNEDDWRSSKLPRTEDSSATATLLGSNGSVFTDGQPQMLCFSAPRPEASVAFPYLNRNAGYSNGNVNMHEVRGPFTASQWVELEHQALIYKYIDANMPVPTNLLFPIRKAFDSVPFSAFACGLHRQNAYGWGGSHLGCANWTDPEPGRCRRTDGKKWRCSRDAMADQKYCDRHMNRGRHRSRKPVEGQTGHPAAGKLTSSSDSALEARGRATNSVSIAQSSQPNNLQSGSVTDLYHSRMLLSNGNTPPDPNPHHFLQLPKHLINFGGDSSAWTTPDHHQHSSLRQFMDNWPNTNDHPQLSISLPFSAKTTDFVPSSASSSPSTKENLTVLSPLRLSRDPFDTTNQAAAYQRQPPHWINNPISSMGNPISSMGGPLAEALHTTAATTNNRVTECRNPSALNLMSDGWEDNSPTGVLQKSSFNSLSNSSAGSSPRAESSKNLCEDLLGSSLVHSAQFSAL